MFRECPHRLLDGHISRSCLDKGFKLFGVHFSNSDFAMRKSASMGNLTYYGSPDARPSSISTMEQTDLETLPEGYVSDDFVHTTSPARERKKGVPWTQEEHRCFLIGLQKLGKGDWRGISRNFVTSRTPTQVASHAQKYFLRRSNVNKRRRRSSMFDITPETVLGVGDHQELPLEETVLSGTELCSRSTLTPSHPKDCGMELDVLKRHQVSVNSSPMALSPHLHSDAEVPVLLNKPSDICEAAKVDGFENLEITQPATGMSTVSPASDCKSGAILDPTFASIWASHWWAGFGGAGRPEPHSTKIVKPTAVFPVAHASIDDSLNISELSLFATRPVMEPTALSFKLLEEGSRQSAFHAMPSVGRSEIGNEGSMSSIISVA